PFLMFQGVQAEAAMNFYLSLFDDAEILQIQRYGAEGPGPEGSVLKARVRLGDQSVHCIDSHVRHAFDVTPAFSFFVDCESNAQIER
ncbi:VOC family protein, partial [Listeria monocytogenes]|nr:VOC family protein [Listeria monocytogenes]